MNNEKQPEVSLESEPIETTIEQLENDYDSWDLDQEDQLSSDLMHEYYEEQYRLDEKNKRISDRVLKVLKRLKGDEWYSNLIEYAKEAEAHNPYLIVRKPLGQWQEESDYELLGGVWVDQSSSYPCEDCFFGTVTVKIDDRRWLEMPFSS